jgi:hypothetical protein
MFVGSTHTCGLTKTSDFTNSSNKLYSTFYNLVWSWITINENHPKCKEYLISRAAINKEKRRHHLSKRWWIIHPFSKLK